MSRTTRRVKTARHFVAEGVRCTPSGAIHYGYREPDSPRVTRFWKRLTTSAVRRFQNSLARAATAGE